MKTTPALLQKGKGFSFFIILCFACSMVFAQTPPTLYILTSFIKVAPENITEYEKIMKENWKPMHQLRKQNGKILNWALYKVHFKGVNDEYNYVAVSYYESFAKCEPNDNWMELMKAANPKADATGIFAKTQSIRSIVKQNLYSRVETVPLKPGSSVKYIEVIFSKTKPGMAAEYLKVSVEDNKPLQQALVDAGQSLGWNLWSQVLPGGSVSDHDFFSSQFFSSFEQMAGTGMQAALTKTGKDGPAILEKYAKSRDRVKREVLEFVMGLN